MNTEQRILCLAARIELDPEAERQLIGLLNGPVDWEQLWVQGNLHDVLPLLATNLRRFQDRAPIPEAWMARAQRRMYMTLMRNTLLANELLAALAALREAGVEALPVKGLVLAETLYGNLALRPAADLDVLVRPRDLPAARMALQGLGFAQASALNASKERMRQAALTPPPPFGPAQGRPLPLRQEKGSKETANTAWKHGANDQPHPFHDQPYFRQTGRGEVCLELHWALWDQHYFQFESDALWERAVPAQLNGTSIRILSPEDTLLHLAIHRARSELRLRFVGDVAALLWRHGATLDWDYTIAQARAARARAALFSALTLARDLLGAPLAADLLPRLGVGPLRRRLLDQTCGAAALFHPARAGDLSQWHHGSLRPLVLDDTSRIVVMLGPKLARVAWRRLCRRMGRLRGATFVR